jgi:hypothetical protein
MKRFLALSVLFGLTGLPLIGCGGGNGSTSFTTNPQGGGAVYVTGEDAPLSSVVSLNLTINSITLSGAHNSPQLIASPITVDFARLVGLRTQLAFKAVPADTYSSATFVLASPVIDVVSAANPPAVTSRGYIQRSDQHEPSDCFGDGDLPHADGCGFKRAGGPAYGIRYPEITGG